MTNVETVRGPVGVDALGPTLMHEHVLMVNSELARDFPHIAWHGDRAAVMNRLTAELQAVRDRGMTTFVDATALNHGRDIPFLKELNERVDINIIVSTGFFTYDELPFFAQTRAAATRDVFLDMFVRDITVGISDTGVKAGLIKCATDEPGVTPNVERLLRACARAHRDTGVPITTHTSVKDRNGLDQQRIFEEEGVDLTRVIIGHCGDSDDFDYLRQILDRGSFIGHDRFGLYWPGWPTFEDRVGTLVKLCELGYVDQMVLSHDAILHTDWIDPANPAWEWPDQWTPTHLSDDVLPALLERGLTQGQIDKMLVHNPHRIFSVRGPY